MTRLLPWLAAALTCVACVKEKKTEQPKTSELTPHFTRTVSGGSVICDAWFSKESDSSNTPVALEDEAIMTCNGNLMIWSGTLFTGLTNYSFGVSVAISLMRQIDGTTLTDTQTVY